MTPRRPQRTHVYVVSEIRDGRCARRTFVAKYLAAATAQAALEAGREVEVYTGDVTDWRTVDPQDWRTWEPVPPADGARYRPTT